MKSLRIALVVLLTLGLLVLWLRTVDLAAMGAALRAARPHWIALAAVASLAHLGIRAWRWRLLLGPGGAGAASLADLFRYMVLGYSVTFVVPGRAGEVVRPLLLWKQAGVPFGKAFGSVVLERVLDVATVGSFLAAFLLLRPEHRTPFLLTLAALLVGAGGGTLLVLAVLSRRHRPLADRLIASMAARAPARLRTPITGFAGSLLDGLQAAFAGGRSVRVLAASVLTWIAVAVSIDAGVRAMDLQVGWTAPLLLVPLTALGIAVPTPAGVGGYHAAATWGLEQLGAATAPAAAAAIVTHAASVLPVIAAGLYASWREGLSLSALRRQASEQAPS